MIRMFLDKLRRLVLGPNLMIFARMPKADLNQLLAISSDEFMFFEQMHDKRSIVGARSTESPFASAALATELQALRMELAIMKERLSVLERINYQNRTTDVQVSKDVSL